MFKIFIVLFTIFTLSIEAFAGGQDVGSGGGSVTCKASLSNPFEGDYFVDYLLYFNSMMKPVPATSFEESLNRIQKGLIKIPWMLASFQKFRADFLLERDYTRENIWESAEFGLIDLNIKDFQTALLPENCQSFHQAVIRISAEVSGLPADRHVFRYVPQLVENLKKSGPLQLSFLFIHEWLWRFNVNADQNGRLNYFFHSGQFEKLNGDSLTAVVKNLGVHKPNQLDPWSPDSCVHDEVYLTQLNAGRNGQPVLGSELGFAAPVILSRRGSSEKRAEDRRDTSEEFRKDYSQGVSFSIEGEKTNYLNLKFNDSSSFFVPTSCSIDETGRMDTSFYCKFFGPVPALKNIMDELTFSLGPNCLRIYGLKEDKNFGSASGPEIKEFVFLFSK